MHPSHLAGQRQHDHCKRHEHGCNKEIIKKFEERPVHIAGDGVCHERIAHQGKCRCAHSDQKGRPCRMGVIHHIPCLCVIAPVPCFRQLKPADSSIIFQRRHYSKVQRHKDNQGKHCSQYGQRPVHTVLFGQAQLAPVGAIAFRCTDITPLAPHGAEARLFLLRPCSTCSIWMCTAHQICSLFEKNRNCTKAITASRMKYTTASAV